MIYELTKTHKGCLSHAPLALMIRDYSMGGHYRPYALITVFDAGLTSRQTRLEITLFVWKSDVK